MKSVISKLEMEILFDAMLPLAGEDADDLTEYIAEASEVDENGNFVFDMPEALSVPTLNMYRDASIYLAPFIVQMTEAIEDESGILMDFARVYFKRITGSDVLEVFSNLKEICLPYMAELDANMESIEEANQI